MSQLVRQNKEVRRHYCLRFIIHSYFLVTNKREYRMWVLALPSPVMAFLHIKETCVGILAVVLILSSSCYCIWDQYPHGTTVHFKNSYRIPGFPWIFHSWFLNHWWKRKVLHIALVICRHLKKLARKGAFGRCLLEFREWRYSQSCWYFRPSFVNYCPSNLLFGWPPPSVPPSLCQSTVYYTDSVWLGGAGRCWLSPVGGQILDSVSDQIQNLQNC